MWSTSNSILELVLFLIFLMILKDKLKFSKSMQFVDDTIFYYSGKYVTNIKEILTLWLPMTSIFVIIGRIYCYQFEWKYLKF